MKTKTSFKHMYLVDNNLYNKLSLNSNLNIDKQTLSHPQNIAIKPNIHIHNKHAPSSRLKYSNPPPPPQPPPPHAPPTQTPHMPALTHAQVGMHHANHNVSTNTNIDSQSLIHPEINEIN